MARSPRGGCPKLTGAFLAWFPRRGFPSTRVPSSEGDVAAIPDGTWVVSASGSGPPASHSPAPRAPPLLSHPE